MFNEIKESQNNQRIETLRDEPDVNSGGALEFDQEFNSSDEEVPYDKWNDDEDEGVGFLDTLCNLLDIKKNEVKPPTKNIVAQIP